MLEEFGWTATVFVVTRFVGRSNRLRGGSRPDVPNLPLLDWGDLAGLQRVWPVLTARAAPGRRVTLATLAEPALGGIRVRLADNRAQLDQTFEARQARLADELAQVVMERLFASAPDLGMLVHG